MERIARVLLILAVAWALCSAVRADVVHLRDGRTFTGTVEEQGDAVRITTAAGIVTLKRAEIDRIERTTSPGEIYKARLAALPPDDADALYDLATWCKAQGLREEHAALIRRALAINPQHAGALDALRRALVTAPLRPEPERAAALRKEFGPRFTVKQSAHYLVAYTCEEKFAGGRIALLERLCKAFYGYFHDGEFPLTPIRKRLVVVIFGSRAEFVAYSKTALPAAMHAGGYYRHDTNRTIFFATYTEEEFRRARQQADRLRQLIAADAGIVPKLRKELTKARQRRDRAAVRRIEGALALAERRTAELTRVEQALRRVENARATIVLHEATHQLVFNTRLLRNPPGDPRWLHEGFAMLFESARAGKWRGLGTPNIDRLQQYRRYETTHQLPALRNLLVNQAVFLRAGRDTQAYYASAWGLLYYLSKRRRADLNVYLRLVARHTPGPVTPKQRLKDFTDAFGTDLTLLETDWRAFMNRAKE